MRKAPKDTRKSSRDAGHVSFDDGTADSMDTGFSRGTEYHGATYGGSTHTRGTEPPVETRLTGGKNPGDELRAKRRFTAKRRQMTGIQDVPWFRGVVTGPDTPEQEQESHLMAAMGFWHIPPRVFLPVVGKATLALYRSRGAIFRERWRIKEAGKFLIHPYSSFRSYWLLATSILTVFNVLITPFGVAFFPDYVLLSADWIGFSICSDIVFLLDIILNFFTSFMKDNEQSLEPKEVKLNYLKTWFILDLLGLIPLDYLLIIDYSTPFARFNDSSTLERLHAYRVMSMLRLIRVSKLVRYADYLEVVQDFSRWGLTGYMPLVYSCLMMILIWHWSSCCQFLIQRIAYFPENGWVHDMAALNSTMEHQYVSSLFRTLSHVVSISYGTLFLPAGVQELWLTSVSMLTLTALYISIISRITAVAFGSYGCTRMYKARYEQCELYLANRRVPKHLQTRILGHLYIRFQGKWFDEEEILQEMSESLRKEVLFHNCHHLVRSVPWFKDTNVINAIIGELKFEVFQKDDIIFRNGSIGKKMYLIDAGVILLDDSSTLISISKGDYFGEYSLLDNRKRTFTAKAFTACRLYALSLESFKKVQDQYPRLIDDVNEAISEN
ncbi:potassium/sodium hyperpolarization-activated cyclic nucleotide-gated channel 2-like isoform X1 [Lissotriton helveticus]